MRRHFLCKKCEKNWKYKEKSSVGIDTIINICEENIMDYQNKNTDDKKSMWQFRLGKDANSMWNELSDEEKSLYDGYEDFYENYKQIKRYAKILSIPVTFLMVVVVLYIINIVTGYNIFSFLL